MIIFINGAFGVGKTTIAENLVSRIPNSLLFDPEEAIVGELMSIVSSASPPLSYPPHPSPPSTQHLSPRDNA